MKIIPAITNFFKKFFKQTVQEQLDIVVPIAKEIVVMIEADPSIIVDGDKRATAIAHVVSELAAKELVFANRLLNLALEIAVVEVKGL